MSTIPQLALGSSRNFVVKRGRGFSVVLAAEQDDGTPADLTDFGVSASIRRWPDTGSLLATFEATVPTPTNGEIWLTLDAATTAAMTSGGHYDVKLTPPAGEPIDFLEGQIVLKGQVTS